MLACAPLIVVGISVLSLWLIADAMPLRQTELYPEENISFFEGDIIIPMHLIDYNKVK
jgi:hypothetical protein